MELLITYPGKAGFEMFENLPGMIYPEGNPGSLLFSQFNIAFLDCCIVLVEQNKPLARLALYNNPYLKYEGKKAICIGNYECIDDSAASSTLLDHAFDWAGRLGAEYVIGPMNGSTWDHYRFGTDHSHPHFLLEPFHPLYYNDQFIHYGFECIANYHSSKTENITLDQALFKQLDKELSGNGVRIRPIDLDQFEQEIEQLFHFLTAQFSANYLFTPIQYDAFKDKYVNVKGIIKPEYCLIATDPNSNMIGFLFCYDDLLNNNEKSLIIKTVVRDKSVQYKGLGQYLVGHILTAALKDGYESMVHAFMICDAASSQISKTLSGRTYKKYALYGKEIKLH